MNKQFLLSLAFAVSFVPSVACADFADDHMQNSASSSTKPAEVVEAKVEEKEEAADVSAQAGKEGQDSAASKTWSAKASAAAVSCGNACKDAGTFGFNMINPMSYIKCVKGMWNAEGSKLAVLTEDKPVVAGLSVAAITAIAAVIYQYQEEINAKFQELKAQFASEEA